MKNFLYIVILLCSVVVFSQQASEKFPVFSNCENISGKALQNCFNTQIQNFIFQNFKVPDVIAQTNYKGNVMVLFEVTENGNFKVQTVDGIYPELNAEAHRVFALLPVIKPATYNGNSMYSRYTLKIAIPLQNPTTTTVASEDKAPKSANKNQKLNELDSIAYKKFDQPIFKSHLNIPFSHNNYARFDKAINKIGSNNHTASKPYNYVEIAKYYDMRAENEKLHLNKKNWLGRKLFNENMVEIQGDGYWFTFNPIADLQFGRSTSNNQSNTTWQNTRAIQVQGGLGEQLNFSTTIFESQGFFADYFNRYAQSIRPAGGNPAIIPGIGIAKEFGTAAFDFPSAEANLTYTPSRFINMQLGYGRNFIGDGYRSLLEGDGASPYPFFKINTTFWKIKYTNNYMWLKDVRPDATIDRTYTTKFMANHYLSWNATNRLNIGVFESVIWTNTNNRGFDFNFVNPIVFYRTVEFASSSRTGNAFLGATAKYKLTNHLNVYSQFILDEFSLGAVTSGEKSWLNKYGYQIGAKYYDAFQVDNLTLQLEYNRVRPYTYSHSDIRTNYGHNNQNIGHQWGANFQEFIMIGRYYKNRFYADAKFTFGTRGFDFNDTTAGINYGGNIYKNYNVNRASDINVKVGQGNKTNVFIAEIQSGYLLNPATNLKIFGQLLYRDFSPSVNTINTFFDATSWFSIGFRTDVFNFYLDN